MTEEQPMIHYSCDRCGRPIDAREELRYVVKVEIEGVLEPTDMDPAIDDERDHLLELHESLERASNVEDFLASESLFVRHRFDLCPDCHRKFLKNPLGKEPAKQLNFSKN
jgi:hypothetical protein